MNGLSYLEVLLNNLSRQYVAQYPANTVDSLLTDTSIRQTPL